LLDSAPFDVSPFRYILIDPRNHKQNLYGRPPARGAILEDLWQRNAVRRTAQLPLIDVKEELEAALHRLAEHE
ncbi:hypothetical protein ACFPM2_30635, partial [Azospirillum picis]|uniref:hypothetical protein n=1 Tax=Azospirillum picis TaxID=488438 RepID=UPI00360B631D